MEHLINISKYYNAIIYKLIFYNLLTINYLCLILVTDKFVFLLTSLELV
jgi:hypothetical protein